MYEVDRMAELTLFYYCVAFLDYKNFAPKYKVFQFIFIKLPDFFQEMYYLFFFIHDGLSNLPLTNKALAMWWNLKIVSPKLKPNKITDDEDKYKN